ncbi:MAG: Gfo/Idh/MocA family oxidoreductase, partial [Ilumatobacteraceae bacterium]
MTDGRTANSRDRTSPVRVGIVGPGWWSETMFVPAIRAHPGALLVAICGRDRARTQAFADANDIADVFTDVDEMYASGMIDAVVISTVNKTHHPLTMSALDHGVHVLCEKPLAMNPREADEMAARASETGLVCMVPFTYRFMPTSQYVKRLVDERYVGVPYLLNLRYYTGFARSGEYAWRFDMAEAGSGVLGDIGAHWIDMARWLLGDIVAVTCTLTHLVDRNPRPDGEPYEQADDGANILVEFASGASGVIVVSAVCYEDSSFGQTHHIDLHGSAGTVYAVNDWDTVQQVRGARDGEPIAELPIPDDIWGNVRRGVVGDTYRDVFRSTDVLARGWISAILADEHV